MFKLSTLDKVVGGSFVAYALFFLAVGTMGLNPTRMFAAILCGCVGAGVGGALAAVLEHTLLMGDRLKRLLPVVGFVIGALAENAIPPVLSDVIDPTVTFSITLGGFLGAFCGLISRRLIMPRNAAFANWSFAVCTILGAVGGLFLAAPGAGILTAFGRPNDRDRDRDRAPYMGIVACVLVVELNPPAADR